VWGKSSARPIKEITERNSAVMAWGNRSPSGNVFPSVKFPLSREKAWAERGKIFSRLGEVRDMGKRALGCGKESRHFFGMSLTEFPWNQGLSDGLEEVGL
jgi:hypothetical protein